MPDTLRILEPLRAFLAFRATDAYLVGGAVRDMLLGRDTHDLDVSVPGSAADLARAFADKIGGAFFLMDETFDVARVILDRHGVRDIVDFAHIRGQGIQEDLATRDFTINAMAADAAVWDGQVWGVIDPFHGLSDLEARRVRAVSEKVFQADAVRLLRAVRMEAELNFVLEQETEVWVKRDAAGIENAPMERVRDEFVKIVGAENVLRNLRRLDTLDLLGKVLPELNPMRGVTQSLPHVHDVFEHTLYAVAAAQETERARYGNLAEGAFGDQLSEHFARRVSGSRTRREFVRLALLLHDTGKPGTRTVEPDGRIRFFGHEDVSAELAGHALRRLKFSNDEVALVKTIIQHHMRPLGFVLSGITDRAIYRFFRATGDAGVDVAVHAWCDQRGTFGGDTSDGEIPALQAVIGRLLDRFFNAHPQVVAPPALLSGQDIMQTLNLPPGRRIGELLEAVREAQAMGEITTRQGALDWLKKFDPPA